MSIFNKKYLKYSSGSRSYLSPWYKLKIILCGNESCAMMVWFYLRSECGPFNFTYKHWDNSLSKVHCASPSDNSNPAKNRLSHTKVVDVERNKIPCFQYVLSEYLFVLGAGGWVTWLCEARAEHTQVASAGLSVLAGCAACARCGSHHRAVGEWDEREASLHVCLPWLQQEILQAVPLADAQQKAHWWVSVRARWAGRGLK